MENSNGAKRSPALRLMPSIDEMLATETSACLISELGRKRALSLVREAAESIRNEIQANTFPRFDGRLDLTREYLLDETSARLQCLLKRANDAMTRRVINATGVVIHTNLGRAPLSENARCAMLEASGYCNIEYDIDAGKRGMRGSNAEKLLANLTGAESAIVVNNCAAAALLILSVFASGREIIVSRGELVEIGGDFRIPDVLTQSGANLREVGTTNRTKLSDYENAVSERASLILRVHPSNYRIVGFTEKPSLPSLAELAHANGMLLYEDAGSGAMSDLSAFGLVDEPVIGQSIAAGVDIVSFSGDKLLGGPQSGLIVGRRVLIEKLRKHPLYRALRVGKIIGAALEATLEDHVGERAESELPVVRMLSISAEDMNKRALLFGKKLERLLDTDSEMTIDLISGSSSVGGGAAPGVSLETTLIGLAHKRHADHELEQALRLSKPPVVARIVDGKVVLDLRTVSESEEEELIDILKGMS
ncbi:MAG: L-seryl-tRNA(Sec) selenium transferase [Pyrinomonadaceae bacterium]